MKVTQSGWVIPEVLKTSFISGYTYNNLCKWTYCDRYGYNFHVDKINENDFIFLNLDYFERFAFEIKQKQLANKFILVTQNSDRDFTKQMFDVIDEYVNKILAINSSYSHSKITKIPLGFNDQSIITLDTLDLSFVEKTELAYLNFRPHTHHSRYECFDYFAKYNWITIEEPKYNFSEFYNRLKTFKYCIAPRGTGIDTHRLYESLLFGVLPIVMKCELDDLYSNLPVVLVDSWKDVTYDFLNDNYQANLDKYFKWLSINPDWYKSKNWINL